MTRYDYEELLQKALSANATQEDINNLGEWFERYNDDAWNGECYDIEKETNGMNLYRIYEEVDEDNFEVIGYEIR